MSAAQRAGAYALAEDLWQRPGMRRVDIQTDTSAGVVVSVQSDQTPGVFYTRPDAEALIALVGGVVVDDVAYGSSAWLVARVVYRGVEVVVNVHYDRPAAESEEGR